MIIRRILEAIESHFVLFWWACVAWAASMFAAKYYWHKSRGRFLKDPPDSEIIYKESWASGRSMKSFRTRLGGASNCLKLMLTSDNLLITPVFPFSILGPELDLIHAIPIESIVSLDHDAAFFRKPLRIRFRNEDGTEGEVEVISRKPQEFEAAIESVRRKH